MISHGNTKTGNRQSFLEIENLIHSVETNAVIVRKEKGDRVEGELQKIKENEWCTAAKCMTLLRG